MTNFVAKWLFAGLVFVGGAATLVSAAGCSEQKMPMMGCMGMMSMMGNMNHSPDHSMDSIKADPAAKDAPAAKPVNSVCPIMGGKVNPSLTREFNGKTVGFCCPMCPKKWDKLADDQKQAKLDKVLKTS